jgi:hypothetical protein
VDIDEEPDLLQPESPKTRTVRFVQTKDNFQIIVTTDGFVGVTLVGSDDDILKLLNVFIEVQSYLIIEKWDYLSH